MIDNMYLKGTVNFKIDADMDIFIRYSIMIKKTLKRLSGPTKKTMAIRNYLVILLQSAIPNCIKKTKAIDRNKACITIIAAGLRQDRGRITTIAAGSRR